MVEDWAGAQVVLAHEPGLLDAPQLLVGADDLGGAHALARDVGDAALEARGGAGARQRGLVQGQAVSWAGDESGAAGGLGAVGDGPGPVLLGGEGGVVVGEAPGAVVRHHPPVVRVSLGRPCWPVAPHGLARKVLDPLFKGGGLSELAVGVGVAVEVGVLGQVVRGPGRLGAHGEAQPSLVQGGQVRAEPDAPIVCLDCWGFFGQCLFCASGCLLQVQEIAFGLVRGAIP